MSASILPIITDLVRDAADPLTGSASDYDSLLAFIGGARFVLLGEASHGTHEFYRERARITQRLILEKKDSPQLPWKLTGLTPIASTAMCKETIPTPMLSRP
jgi:hypothetical protein